MTSPRLASAALAATLLALASAAAHAHHGAPGYDTSQMVEVDGTVVRLDWKNPHIYFTLETKGEDGQLRRFTIEGGTLSRVRAAGLTREQLAVGTHARVHGFAKQKGLAGPMLGITLTLDDGSRLNLGPGSTATAPRVEGAANGLAGKWAASPNAVLDFLNAVS